MTKILKREKQSMYRNLPLTDSLTSGAPKYDEVAQQQPPVKTQAKLKRKK